MHKDLGYISELIDDFFSQEGIQSALKIITEFKITGWEIWFQIEFSRFISQHETNPEWWREYTVKADQPAAVGKDRFRPDFLLRRKEWPGDSYAVLEAKVNQSVANCVRGMLGDLGKSSSVRTSEIQVRSHWALGIHGTGGHEENELKQLVAEEVEQSSLPIDDRNQIIRCLPGGVFAYSLFGFPG